jgi:hypothetical protein
MEGQIRVVAEPHDPVSANRLVRLLLVEAQLELQRRQAEQAKQNQDAANGAEVAE